MREYWDLKRKLSGLVSNALIDEIYAAAMEEGAYGGKVPGAGGGGFFLIIANQRHHAAIKKRLKKILFVPVKTNSQGSKLIYSVPL